MSDLMALVGALNPDVIGITESCGNEDIADSEFNLPGFDMFRTDRKKWTPWRRRFTVCQVQHERSGGTT